MNGYSLYSLYSLILADSTMTTRLVGILMTARRIVVAGYGGSILGARLGGWMDGWDMMTYVD